MMKTTIDSPSVIKSAIESGEIKEAKRMCLVTTNKKWDVDTNYHFHDWAPVRIKSSFYDNVPGFLNLDPFMFTDEEDDDAPKIDCDSDLVTFSTKAFTYLFRRVADGQQERVEGTAQ
jgi:hypothetical protein